MCAASPSSTDCSPEPELGNDKGRGGSWKRLRTGPTNYAAKKTLIRRGRGRTISLDQFRDAGGQLLVVDHIEHPTAAVLAARAVGAGQSTLLVHIAEDRVVLCP